MRYRALRIAIGERHCGLLFQYGQGHSALMRFVPDRGFWLDPQAPVVSWAVRASDERDREQLLAHAADHPFCKRLAKAC